ncbi:glycosyltransferase [Patescibacteria group bacterium]|nr:glycosyltransferase [Candidatus Falkowbacteria bacterium]MBU3906007.1 glycosyltransferase [Patescibacteria group bacterium]MBU4026296.1 glycosyltransferase [Patescibacteria group bacterium]MBU4073183.1 glycosyltransferase [Patescibacteria group bacterium]MBU4102695.1 glycosyltransferase [Patescibacteria group bacterium]
MKIYKKFKNYIRSLSPFYYGKMNRYKIPIKYVISGGTAAFVDLALLYALTDIFGVYYLLSASMAFLVAFFISFYLQKFWTFRDNSNKQIYQQMFLYLFVGIVNLGINTAGMYILVEHIFSELLYLGKFNITYVLSQVIMGGIIAVGSFLVYRFVIFKKRKKELKIDKDKRVLKILIATGIFPPDIGGPATMLKDLASSLADNNFKVKIITYSNGARSESEDKNISRIVRGRFFSRLKYFLQMLKLAGWADIIYVTDTYSAGRFAYYIKKILNKKYIVRFAGDSAWEIAAANGWISDYIADFQKKIYGRRVEKLKNQRKKILINADKVIAVSYFLKGIAKDIGVREDKIEVIYNSVDFIDLDSLESKTKAARDSLKLENFKIIMTAGRLVPWKGADGLIKSLAYLKEDKSLPLVKLIIVGDGPDRGRLEELAKEQEAGDTVIFTGKIPLEEVYAYYNLADVFVLNSQYEGLSHVILEALSLGKPVIASNCGGNPEVVEHGKNGLLIPYNNEKELSSAIKRMLVEEKWNNLGEVCAQSIKKFNWKNNIAATVNLLRKVG